MFVSLYEGSVQWNKINSLSEAIYISEQVYIGINWHGTGVYYTFTNGSSVKLWGAYCTSVRTTFEFLRYCVCEMQVNASVWSLELCHLCFLLVNIRRLTLLLSKSKMRWNSLMLALTWKWCHLQHLTFCHLNLKLPSQFRSKKFKAIFQGDHTVLPTTHTPAFTPQPQGVASGWLAKYWGKCPKLEIEPGHGHPSQY